MPSPPVTWSLAPSIISYRTNAICEIGRPLRAEGATRATWTSADPPSGWLAGLSGDDPVLGGRLGRGHRAAQPATAITQRAPTIAFQFGGNDRRQEMRTTTKRRAGQLAPVTVAAAPGRRLHAALWPRTAGRPAQAAANYHRHLETAIAATRPASWLTDGRGPRAGSRLRLLPRPGHTAAQSGASAPSAYRQAILGAEGWFTGWPDGQPASVGTPTTASGRGPAPLSTAPPALSWRYP